jgi:hypothetical protein
VRPLLPEELAEYAEAYGLTAAAAQRDYVAVRVAHAMASDAEIRGNLALKGGFVLRYGYGSPRTSKDIDGTIGTRHAALDPARVQRVVGRQCADLQLRFRPRTPTIGADSLEFGGIHYAGPVGPGFLSLELSFREDLLRPARELEIEAFGVPHFAVRALAIDEMIAEKWRCLVQRSPRRPGDPYDLWYLWSDFQHRRPRTADDIIDPQQVRELTAQKVDLHDGASAVAASLEAYRSGWPGAIGDVLPVDGPRFGEVREAVLQATRAWTPWR